MTAQTSSAVTQSVFRRFLDSPAGPKTIHFWAPTMKWALVFAGIGDLQRPVENLSLTQNFSIMLTGLIWSRYSLVIKPKNYNLLTVNIFVFGTGAMQVGRILKHRFSDEYKQQQELKAEKS